jgi:hypothetical protein
MVPALTSSVKTIQVCGPWASIQRHARGRSSAAIVYIAQVCLALQQADRAEASRNAVSIDLLSTGT